MMSNVFFKLFSSINIIIVTVISYDNIRFSNYILYETNTFYCFIGIYIIWVRTIVHFVYLQLYQIKLVSYTSISIIIFLTFFFLSSTLEIPFPTLPKVQHLTDYALLIFLFTTKGMHLVVNLFFPRTDWSYTAYKFPQKTLVPCFGSPIFEWQYFLLIVYREKQR